MQEMHLCTVLSKFGIRPGLERISRLMDVFGHPERAIKVILVTGTNGKGSVTSYLASILKEGGYKTGSYFSPHLKKYNERFKINGKDISDAKLKKYEKLILNLFERGKNSERFEITEFEALTAIAYKYFADENCDFAVMEIGMGGRFDATNIAEECIGIITNVDFDHTKYLGSTIEKIAFEKAGILKKGIGITAATGKALETIKKEAKSRNITLLVLNEDFFAKILSANNKFTLFNFIGHKFYNNLKIKLLGRYQVYNAALAVAAAEELGIEHTAIRNGLKKAKHPVRLEVIAPKSKTKNTGPIILFDAAHNPHGIKELVNNLSLFDYDKLICIFSAMKDKDWKEMLRILAPHCDLLVINQTGIERAEDAEQIAKNASIYTKTIIEKDVKKSFTLAKKHAKKKDMILVCGSIYMLCELLRQ